MIPAFQTSRQLMLIGKYGSGKTEIALNLARHFAATEGKCALVDLDVVTPAWRVRDYADVLAPLGVDVIAPEGPARASDLPALNRRIAGTLTQSDYRAIIDMGGDEAGLAVLGRFKSLLHQVSVFLVVNPYRQTFSVPRLLELVDDLHRTVGRKPSGIIANPNLGGATRPSTILEGLPEVLKLQEELGVPIVAVTYWQALQPPLSDDAFVWLPVERFMRLPWESS